MTQLLIYGCIFSIYAIIGLICYALLKHLGILNLLDDLVKNSIFSVFKVDYDETDKFND